MVEKSIHFIMHQFTEHHDLLVLIVIGLIAGLIAQMILPGKGFGLGGTAVIGIVGCWIGNMYILPYIHFVENETIKKILAGTVGAMGLSFVFGLFRLYKVKDKTKYRNNP